MRIAFLLLLPFLVLGQKMPLKQSPVFSPTDLTPLIWYDSRPADMASDGTQWTDRMGNYNVTAGVGSGPTYNSSAQNGLPGFVFSGSLELTNASGVSSLNNLSGITFWLVCKRGGFGRTDGSTSHNIEFFHYSADDKIYTVLSGGGYNHGSVASTNAFHYSVSIFDGTQTGNSNRLVTYVNSVLQTLTFSGTIPAVTETGSSTFHVGSASGVLLPGTVCEIGIVTRAITSGERASLNTYLAAKYAL